MCQPSTGQSASRVIARQRNLVPVRLGLKWSQVQILSARLSGMCCDQKMTRWSPTSVREDFLYWYQGFLACHPSIVLPRPRFQHHDANLHWADPLRQRRVQRAVEAGSTAPSTIPRAVHRAPTRRSSWGQSLSRLSRVRAAARGSGHRPPGSLRTENRRTRLRRRCAVRRLDPTLWLRHR
jgi:hypothetical protein